MELATTEDSRFTLAKDVAAFTNSTQKWKSTGKQIHSIETASECCSALARKPWQG
jgi:hypothetical protein